MLSLSNLTDEALSTLGFYGTILLGNFLAISFLTGQARLRNKAFANPEDAVKQGSPSFYRKHEEVSRLKRINRNDTENVLPFLALAFLLATTGVRQSVLLWFMRVFTVSRMVYTVSYAKEWKAPARSVIYCIGAYLCYLPMLFIVGYYAM